MGENQKVADDEKIRKFWKKRNDLRKLGKKRKIGEGKFSTKRGS
jgi:hypothetical protein